MRKALIILAQQGYQDKELEGTRAALDAAGFETVIAATQAGECTGKFGGTEQAIVALKDVRVKDYDRIAYMGGPGASAYANDPNALRIAHETVRANIPLGAICIAPTILAKAHVLDGRKATVWDNGGEQIGILETYGAEYTGDMVTIDGLIVTGNGPEAAEEFGKTLVALN